MTMTLNKFRASRVFVADARTLLGDLRDCYWDKENDCPVYLYDANLIIDCDASGAQTSCTIGNDSRDGMLAELEEWLYEYGISEGLF